MVTVQPTQSWQHELMSAGYELAAGVDEVGRGAWAGPLVAAAVVLPPQASLTGVTDSKALSLRQREALESAIKREAIAVGIGWVPAAELDQLGLTAASRLAVERSLSDLVRPVEAVMLDGKHNILEGGQWLASARPKADSTELAVAAASVVAKLARDRYMAMLARLYPEYGFERHVGYGTAAHRVAMESHGLTPVHRRSYAPVKKLAVVAN